jgi:Cu2+-exporting ATPase
VALALLLTFVSSTVALLTHSGQHYFDAITMFVFLLLGARWIESALRQRTAEQIERLSNARPLQCYRLPDFPSSERIDNVPASSLAVGDMVSVRPGDVIPADAIVIRGQSEVDEALMTGESRPVARGAGDKLIGGTINGSSPLIAQITAVGEQTVLARLGKMVEAGLHFRPAFQGIAERAARWLAPATLLAAMMAGIFWWQIDRSRAVEIAIAVLAVTCPCAFALAAPTALAGALSRLANRGVMVARGHLIETLANATDVVFDKTGTLTTGQMTVVSMTCECAAPLDVLHVLRIAIAMERGAAHPAAKAITAYAEAQLAASHNNHSVPVATALRSVAGLGVEATIDGHRYRLGRPDIADAKSHSGEVDGLTVHQSGNTVIVLRCVNVGVDDNLGVNVEALSAGPALRAMFTLADPIRTDAAACLHQLKSAGLTIHLLSGDAAAVVNRVAATLEINGAHVRDSQSPTDKRDYVQALRMRGATVIAVGDGVNDAPMLAEANGSIGLADGAALTRLSADAVLAARRERLLAALDDAFGTARATKNRIAENLLWALAYNVIAIPLAVAGAVTPLLAALGMALSSLVVVLNASRLSWHRDSSPNGSA